MKKQNELIMAVTKLKLSGIISLSEQIDFENKIKIKFEKKSKK